MHVGIGLVDRTRENILSPSGLFRPAHSSSAETTPTSISSTVETFARKLAATCPPRLVSGSPCFRSAVFPAIQAVDADGSSLGGDE
jgi:hypothetical protein